MKIYLCCLFFLLAGLLLGQPAGFLVHNLQDNALNKVILQDRDGILWIGTSMGLLKYDGVDYKEMAFEKEHKNKVVSSLFEDAGRRLWIGFEDGKIARLSSDQKIIDWEPQEGLPRVKITGITQDANGLIWFGTYGEGAYYFDEVHVFNLNENDGLPNNDIYTIAADKQGRIWIGTDGGVSICSIVNTKKNIHTLTKKDGLSDNIIKVIVKGRNDQMWMGFQEGGIASCKTTKNSFDQITNFTIEAGEVTSIAEDFSGDLWVGTDDNGLWQYKSDFQDFDIKKHWDHYDGFENTKIYSLYSDFQGNTWISTSQFGLLSKQGLFEHWQVPIKNIQVIDHSKHFWIGTANGLYQYLHSTKKFIKTELPGITAPNIISLLNDSYGNTWVGTYGQGLYYIREKKIIKIEGIENENIFSIAQDGETIWIATLAGVFTVSKSGETFVVNNINKKYGLKENFIYKILVDSKKRIWLGTDGEGLKLIEKDKPVKSYTTALGRPLKTIYSIDEDRTGNIWISVAAYGIFCLHNNEWKHYGIENSLRSNNVPNLVTDKYGHVIILNEKGIDLLLPSTGNVLKLDKLLDLKNFKSNLNMSFKEGNSVWFVNNDEIIYCKPLPDSALQPRVVISSISVMGKKIKTGVHIFPYNQNFISFNLSGIFYALSNEVIFDYKLIGHDLEWNTTNDRNISFQNIGSGKYTLKIYARLGNTKSALLSYSFIIQTPFWKQLWFISLIVLLVFTSIIFIIRLRERRLQKTALLEQESISAQFEALKSQINPHFLFNTLNTLIAVIEDNPQTAVSFVEQISDFYRKILQYREQKLISLSEEMSLVTSFSYLLKERFGDSLQIITDIDNEEGYIIPFSIQMLLENAVKHNVISSEKRLTISIIKNDRFITITNNLQPKLHKEASTGFGLGSIIKHYEMITKEKVLIEKTDTSFKVSLPILKNDKTKE